MTQTISNFKGQEFQVELTYSHTFNGKGSYIINIDVMYEADRMIYIKQFHVFTTNVRLIDDIKELRDDNASHKDIQSRYHNAIFDTNLEEEILEWVEMMNNLLD
jgi:hypothetical protein